MFFVEHDPLIWLGLRQSGSVLYYDALCHSSLQPFYTQRRVFFTSLYVNFTDLIVCSSCGIGDRCAEMGTHGTLIFGLPGCRRKVLVLKSYLHMKE